MKPILFNTEMVRAIQENRKTVTRRVIKYSCPSKPESTLDDFIGTGDPQLLVGCAPYAVGDILYVRETWAKSMAGTYLYRATDTPIILDRWHPSIHMPKEAARLFLRVMGVRVERLQDATERDAQNEGFRSKEELITAIRKMYPEAGENPWVWVIEFERVSRGETLGGGGDG